MKKITPFLWFENQAEEAMGFYMSVFPNSKVVSFVRNHEGDPGPKGTLLVATVSLNGEDFMLLNGGPSQAGFNMAVSMVVNCDTQAEIDHYWEKLSSGGGATNVCGWLKDRYGLHWQIVPASLGKIMSGDPEKAHRAMQAVWQMSKLDIAKIEAAYEGK